MTHLLRKPLTRRRIWLAFGIAVAADASQLILGPMGWVLFDETVDVVAMSLLVFVIGFHPLFLPTFVVEFMPVTDMLPTWTGCVAVVIALRRKQQPAEPVSPPPPSRNDVIDI